jgi:O-antigen ligase
MVTITRIGLLKFLALSLPIFPLLEGVLVEPYGNPKINLGINTFPLLHLLFLTILLWWSYYQKLKLEVVSIFIVLLVLIYSCIAPDPNIKNISYIICVLYSYTLISINWNQDVIYERVKYFMVFLAIASILIMIFRLNMYHFNFIRARSGANIYGANAVFNLYLVFFCYHFLVIRDRSKDPLHFILMAILAFVFISKTAIVIIFALFISYRLIFSKMDVKGLIKILLYFILTSISVYFILFFTSLGETILLRFGFEDFTNEGLSFVIEKMLTVQKEQQRGVLWSDAVMLIQSNPGFGVGIGLYSNYGEQTSAHNIILNNLAEFGLILGTLLTICFICPFIMIIKYKFGMKEKIFSLLIYFLFFLQAVLAGQKIIQSSGYISSFVLFVFFALIYQLRFGNKKVTENYIYEK